MGLLSIFRRTDKSPVPPATTEASDAVREARMRARRRLIGAVVLLVIGVIGFPLVFETQPRPIPVDIPIEIPKKDGAPALVMPPARPAADSAQSPAAPAAPIARAPAAPSAEIITESRSDAGREVAPRASSEASAHTAERPAPKPEAKPAAAVAEAARKVAPSPASESGHKPAAPAVAEAARKPAATSVTGDGARAKALLDAKPTAAVEGARYVVQVGAFAEAASARETRLKAEKLGMKTYTQVAQTPSGSRIRVRVGPFGSRAEADAALAKARAAGLTAVVLTL